MQTKVPVKSAFTNMTDSEWSFQVHAGDYDSSRLVVDIGLEFKPFVRTFLPSSYLAMALRISSGFNDCAANSVLGGWHSGCLPLC